MEKPTRLLNWTPSFTAVEPSSTKKSLGWTAGEKPPYEYFNWAWETESLWQDYLSTFTDFKDTSGTIFIGTGYSATPHNNSNSVVIGKDNAPVANGAYNAVVIGYNNLALLTTGARNIVLGKDNLPILTTGAENIAIGTGVLESSVTNSFNIGMGSSTLRDAIGSYNVAIGYFAGACTGAPIIAQYNVFIGSQAAQNLSDIGSPSERNVIIGSATCYSSTTLAGEVVIGANACESGTPGLSTIVGYRSCKTADSILRSVVIGRDAVQYEAATACSDSEVLGYKAAEYSTVVNCVIIGKEAAQASSGSHGAPIDSVIIGTSAAHNITTAEKNVFIGKESGYRITTGTVNACLGYKSGYALTTGEGNIFVGSEAASAASTAQYNVVIGWQAGSQLSTGINNVIIGTQAGSAVTNHSNVIIIGASTTVSPASNSIHLGKNTHTAFHCLAALNNISTSPVDLHIDANGKIGTIASSKRYKKQITDMEDTSWIYDIRPVNFIYKNDETQTKQFGLIAEEVEKINKDFVHYKDGKIETVLYSKFIPVLLKEIQELKKLITKLSK